MLHAILAASALALTGPQAGSPAPEFNLTTLDGKHVTLSSFHGKTLVLNAWATWCPPCREETPDLIATAKRLFPTARTHYEIAARTTLNRPEQRYLEARAAALDRR